MVDSALTITAKGHTADSASFALAGAITERADFSPLLQAPQAKLTLDLDAISRINSTGVREWLRFVANAAKAGKSLVFQRCSVQIVQQLNMINNFAGRGIVASVFAPYYCSSCGSSHRQLIELSPETTAECLEKALACPSCGKEMELDEDASSYLGFRTP